MLSLVGRGGGRKREKVRPAHEKWPKMGVLWRAGGTSSRKRGWRAALGELIRGNVAGGVVRGELLRRNAAGGGVPGELADQQS